VYYNRLKNSKIVISDFHLAKLENGLIKEPCGTPEYLGKEGWDRGWSEGQPSGGDFGVGKKPLFQEMGIDAAVYGHT
jgi:hypothetical protein